MVLANKVEHIRTFMKETYRKAYWGKKKLHTHFFRAVIVKLIIKCSNGPKTLFRSKTFFPGQSTVGSKSAFAIQA